MLKLVMLAGLVLMSFIVASAMRLMPHEPTAETMTPQQEYFRLLSLDRSLEGHPSHWADCGEYREAARAAIGRKQMRP